MLPLILNAARGARAVRSASKMLPDRSTKKKGGALVTVPQQTPTLTQFAGEAEKRKEQARPSFNKSAFFRAPKIGEPKKGATKMKTVENKVSKISEFFAKANKKRKEAFKSFLRSEQEEKRKEREAKRENFATRLGKGIKNKALAPVKSIFDRILDAIGKIILAKIAMWAIDNPDAFIKLIQVLERVITISTDIFIGTIDFMGTVINEGYKLVDGFNDWTKENLGQDVADTFNDLGGKLVNFLNAGLIVGGLLLARGQQELGEKPESPDKTKPEKPPKQKGPKKADKTTRTRRASQEARKRYARRYGKDAAKQRFGGKTRGPIKGSITRRGLGRSVTRLGIKMNPAMVKNMKGIAKLAKGIKIPIIGPLVMGITSYLGDGNLGKAVFVALGTGIGELLGTAIPIPVVGTLLGGILGGFIGDLLYDIIVKKNPGAALKKVQGAAKKIFETGKAVFDWLKGSFGRFIESFKEKNQIGIGFAKTTNWLALLDLTKTIPLLKDSFFPSQPNPPTPNLGDFSDDEERVEMVEDGPSPVYPQDKLVPKGKAKSNITGTNEERWKAFYAMGKKAGAKYPNLVAAQFALESGWGTKLSGRNNFFGIKATKSESATVHRTREVVNGKDVYIDARFKNFDTPQDAVNHLVTQWYKDYRGYKGVNNSPSAFAAADQLLRESYATDPQYAKSLKRLLTQYAGIEGSDGDIKNIPSDVASKIVAPDPGDPRTEVPSPAVVSSSNPPSSPAASAVPTLSSSSTSQSSAVAPVGAQGMIPLPIPISGQKAVPSGSMMISNMSSGVSLNSYYRAQLFGFLYKQG